MLNQTERIALIQAMRDAEEAIGAPDDPMLAVFEDYLLVAMAEHELIPKQDLDPFDRCVAKLHEDESSRCRLRVHDEGLHYMWRRDHAVVSWEDGIHDKLSRAAWRSFNDPPANLD